jgi:ATP-dependent helicase/nuclease subunit B
MLGLCALDAIDADPSPAWRGSAVHEVLEAWMNRIECDPAGSAPVRSAAGRQLRPSADAALVAAAPLEAIDWIAEQVARNRAGAAARSRPRRRANASGRRIEALGIADRIDRLRTAPCHRRLQDRQAAGRKAVREGYSMQLGCSA